MEWEPKYFKQEEFVHAQRMSPDFLKRLDRWRKWVDTPIIIIQSNATKEEELEQYGKLLHGETSNHYLNYAVDVILPDTKLGLLDQWLSAIRFFSGVGMYPKWKHRAHPKIKGGLHVEWLTGQIAQRHWIGIGGVYLGVREKTLIENKLLGRTK